MHFDAEKKKISDLLSAKRQFTIPRFQREYSWEKTQLKEFFEDIISQINLVNDRLINTEYFWGSMLFIGNFLETSSEQLEVVDGQQRLTTITIFLAVLAKTIRADRSVTPDIADGLAKKVEEYIIYSNDNMEKKAVLLNETPNPYFQRLVQRSDIPDATPSTAEENLIKQAYDYFEDNLKKPKLVKAFQDHKNIDVNPFDHLDILKAIRDQLLNSIIICLCTPDKKQANMIFEILNAKGMSLDSIDLIKNEIFSVITDESPSDEAKLKWKKIRDNLNSRNNLVDFSGFFRHFWLSNYSKVPEKKLYKEFKNKIKPPNEATYAAFLNRMVIESDYYVKILSPRYEDFQNKVDFKYIYDILNNIDSVFNITQSRILILSIYDSYFAKRNIGAGKMKEVLQKIETFHFVFNGLFSQGTNIMEKTYSNYALQLRKAADKNAVHIIIDVLINELNEILKNLIPTLNIFEQKFIALQYSKNNANKTTNLRAKYAVRALSKYYSGSDLISPELSIEHIKDESSGEPKTMLIGNLLGLEKDINQSLQSFAFPQKIQEYKNSNYPVVKNFVDEYGGQADWTETDIDARGKKLAAIFYEHIIGFKPS